MCGLNRGALGKSDVKAIAQRLLVVSQGVKFEALDRAAGIGDDRDAVAGN